MKSKLKTRSVRAELPKTTMDAVDIIAMQHGKQLKPFVELLLLTAASQPKRLKEFLK